MVHPDTPIAARRSLSALVGAGRVRTALVSLTILATPIAAEGTQEVTGRLEGRVLAVEGDPIASAQITLSGPTLQGTRTTTADNNGTFRVPGLPVGRYTVRIGAIGHRGTVYENVQIQLGRTTTLGEVRLETATLELPALVVEGARPAIDPTTTTFGANLAARDFEALPIDRDYQSIISMLPQANTSYLGDGVNIAGATGLGNVYVIDGINVTDPYTATSGTRLPSNFVQEIQLKEGGYEAEFGKALGGIVNVVTNSGSNEFEVGGFGYFTNGALAADGRPGLVDQTLRDFATYDVGVSASGPLLRDRVWFSLAYNPSFETQELEIPGFGFNDDRLVSHRFAGKLTWQASDHTSIVFTTFGDPTTHHQVSLAAVGDQNPAEMLNPDPLLRFSKRGAVNLSLQGRTLLGERALLETSIARSGAWDDLSGDSERARSEPLFQDQRTNTWSGGVATQGTKDISRFSARLAATMFLGEHTVKTGLEYEENVVTIDGATNGPGIITQTADAEFTVNRIVTDVRVRNRVPTVFVQDGWRASRRVTLYAGMRWDAQYLIGVGDSVAQSITDQFQPRLGLTLQTGELGTQQIAASYGRFYETLPLFFSGLEHGGGEQCLYAYASDPRTASQDQGVPFLCLLNPGVPRSPKVDDLEGQHYDEFTLGYERTFGGVLKVGVRGIYRTLRAVVGVGIQPTLETTGGNPGRGALDFLPEPQRDYTALEVTTSRFGPGRLNFQVSYTLSRTYGNYTGLFASDVRASLPNWNAGLQVAEQDSNSTGLLPNDRPHVFKAFGSYRVTDRVTAGTFVTWQSGTPLTEYGAWFPVGFFPVFLVPRGSAGRTPAIWDLSLRFTYDLSRLPALSGGRVVIDLLHVGNPRKVVVIDQARYLGRLPDGTHVSPNPGFGGALRHQPPMTLRFGVELGWTH